MGFLNTILAIAASVIAAVGILLILLYFRLDRLAFRVENRWRGIRTLLSALIRENMAGPWPEDTKTLGEAFLKSRKQGAQVAAANALSSVMTVAGQDAAELRSRCEKYNEAARAFNQTLEAPLWRFVAGLFRVRPKPEIDSFRYVPAE